MQPQMAKEQLKKVIETLYKIEEQFKQMRDSLNLELDEINNKYEL